ncbi:MAG: VOC family protein [Spirochaetaceae bacterium]|jgi:lactoylglutathione lyase|nr:VOC family protein [Spirochaetaceae bacterium]
MQYAHITLRVRDLEKSLAFYQGVLGLPVVRRLGGPNGPVFLGETAGPTIELIGGAEDPRFAGFSIGFTVDSLAEAEKRLEEAGFSRIRGPLSPNPSVVFSFFGDPDGVEIQLVEYRNG